MDDNHIFKQLRHAAKDLARDIIPLAYFRIEHLYDSQHRQVVQTGMPSIEKQLLDSVTNFLKTDDIRKVLAENLSATKLLVLLDLKEVLNEGDNSFSFNYEMGAVTFNWSASTTSKYQGVSLAYDAMRKMNLSGLFIEDVLKEYIVASVHSKDTAQNGDAFSLIPELSCGAQRILVLITKNGQFSGLYDIADEDALENQRKILRLESATGANIPVVPQADRPERQNETVFVMKTNEGAISTSVVRIYHSAQPPELVTLFSLETPEKAAGLTDKEAIEVLWNNIAKTPAVLPMLLKWYPYQLVVADKTTDSIRCSDHIEPVIPQASVWRQKRADTPTIPKATFRF